MLLLSLRFLLLCFSNSNVKIFDFNKETLTTLRYNPLSKASSVPHLEKLCTVTMVTYYINILSLIHSKQKYELIYYEYCQICEAVLHFTVEQK